MKPQKDLKRLFLTSTWDYLNHLGLTPDWVAELYNQTLDYESTITTLKKKIIVLENRVSKLEAKVRT